VSGRRALAGIVATVPHTAALVAGSSLGSRPLPPAEVVSRATRTPVSAPVWLAVHFTTGAVLGLAARAVRPERSRSRGAGYGLAVWALSYVLLLPRMRLYPHVAEDEPARRAANVAGHALFGLTLAALTRRFSP
jgi:hypothetical protein